MKEFILVVFLTITCLMIEVLLYSIPVYYLWNWLMQDLFNIKEITFMQSIGICFLSESLFKSNFSTTKN